jgi:hypothetical protein
MSYIPIPYPNTPSEFEVQARLLMALRASGVKASGEVITHRWNRRRECMQTASKLDIVVYNKERDAVMIIEVKSDLVEDFPSDQCNRYEDMHDVCTIACMGMKDIADTVSAVLTYPGVK